MAVAVDRQHGVDDVFEHARSGQLAVLGDVADHDHRDSAALRLLHQPVGALPHLCHRSRRRGVGRGRTWSARSRRRTHRDPTASMWAMTLGSAVSATSISRSTSAPRRSARSRTCCDRLLARDVQDRAPGAGPGGQHLEDQGRLADARFTTEQRDAARDQPAPEDAVQLVDPGRARGRCRLWSAAVIGTGRVAGASDGVRSTGASSSSARVFQSSHPGQRPAHLGAAPPQRRASKDCPGAGHVRTIGTRSDSAGDAGTSPAVL